MNTINDNNTINDKNNHEKKKKSRQRTSTCFRGLIGGRGYLLIIGTRGIFSFGLDFPFCPAVACNDVFFYGPRNDHLWVLGTPWAIYL